MKGKSHCDKSNIFQDVKDRVTTIQAARAYGFDVKRTGMMCCPFHDDRTPSMKVDKRFHCFGCGEDGNVIDFTAKVFGLSPIEAAQKLAEDFNIPYEKPEKNKTKKKPIPKRNVNYERYRKLEDRFFLILIQYRNRLDLWRELFAPEDEEQEWDELFCESLEKSDRIQYLLQCFLEADFEGRVDIMNEYGKEVKAIEYRLREADRGSDECA